MEEHPNRAGSGGKEDDAQEQRGDKAAKSKDREERDASKEAVEDEEQTGGPPTEGE